MILPTPLNLRGEPHSPPPPPLATPLHLTRRQTQANQLIHSHLMNFYWAAWDPNPQDLTFEVINIDNVTIFLGHMGISHYIIMLIFIHIELLK